MSNFDFPGFILSLLVDGGPTMIISGWIAAQWTKATGVVMLIQTFVVALVVTAISALVGLIPVPITEFLHFLALSVTNGTIAALIYKTGIFNSLLEAMKARTAHQLEP